MAGDPQQRLALGKRFRDQAEFVLLEVAQPSVNQLRRRGGGRAGEVVAFDQGGLQAAAGRVARDPGAVDAAADDKDVVLHSRGTIAERPALREKASRTARCRWPSSAGRASGL